jgi:hypothetical protein
MMPAATKVTPPTAAEQLAQDIWIYVRVAAQRSPLSADVHCKEIARMIEAGKIYLLSRFNDMQTEHAKHQRG